MISSFYTAATGTIELQKNLDVIGNNLANVNTNGYKAQRGSFADLLYTNMRQPEAEGNSDLHKGHGARLGKVDNMFLQGRPRQTDSQLDFMISDNTSYFVVETPDGVKYTRNGSFHLSEEAGGTYLVDSTRSGYVLNAAGQRTLVSPAMLENPELMNIGLAAFVNQEGLQRESGTYFTPTANSGNPIPVQSTKLLKQGYLEDSNVDTAFEMTDLIITQRAFQFSSKMVQTADEIMQTVNSLR